MNAPANCMISNDRQTSQAQANRPHRSFKPPVAEDTLKSDKIQIERKTFLFSLRENPRGRFLRITEDVGGRRDTIIIPAPGLEDFKKILDDMVQAAADTPPKAAD
jgi:PurA-like ssDNA and RNA-binding protein